MSETVVMQPGTHEGHLCLVDGCQGKLAYPPGENCSCHLNPPCDACTSVKLTCSDCWREVEE